MIVIVVLDPGLKQVCQGFEPIEPLWQSTFLTASWRQIMGKRGKRREVAAKYI
jgi:hypothetical protein